MSCSSGGKRENQKTKSTHEEHPTSQANGERRGVQSKVVSGTPIDIIAGGVVGPGILARKIEKEKRPDVAASSKTGRCQSPPARRGTRTHTR